MQAHLQEREALRYRPSSGEQAWRKRADLRTRLKGLRSEQAPLPPLPWADPRQIENIIATRNKIQDTRSEIFAPCGSGHFAPAELRSSRTPRAIDIPLLAERRRLRPCR